jgi:two-component system, chemotaxis family, chemotaxis protein CheY
VMAVDLLIVDINMPQMDGLTFLRLLRKKAAAVDAIPALITSTESGAGDFAAARSAGANFYLVKPIDPAMLVEIAAVFCGVRK